MQHLRACGCVITQMGCRTPHIGVPTPQLGLSSLNSGNTAFPGNGQQTPATLLITAELEAESERGWAKLKALEPEIMAVPQLREMYEALLQRRGRHPVPSDTLS
jgi:hypothetical protein